MGFHVPTIVPITQAKARLAELVDTAATENVILTRRGHAAAVIIDATRYEDLMERLEDAEDALAVATADPDEATVPAEEILTTI